MNKALFLDRDGIINIDYGYVYKIEDFDFIHGIFDLALEARNKGYLIVIITNQAGIGRGYYSISDFNILTDWMSNVFLSKGISISKVYFSPYHPFHGKGKYKKNHVSRKPNIGMIREAEDEFRINLSKSLLVGDNLTDIQAGKASGIGKNILYTGTDKCSPDSNLIQHTVQCLSDVKLFL